MNPLLAPIIGQIIGALLNSGGVVSAPTSQSGAGQPTAPVPVGADLAALAAIIAAAQRPAEPPPEVKLPKWIGALAILFVLGFFSVLGARIGLEYFGPAAADTTILDVAFGVLTSGLMVILSFAFGSSWGSRTKDVQRRQEGSGSPLVLPGPILPAKPVTPTPTPAPAPGGEEPSVPPPSIDGIGRSTDPSTADLRSDVPNDGRPASIRYHNPGAQYPSARGATFGQLGYGIIGGGHKIARFPHPVNGAAANFELLRHNYVGMAIGAAGAKWTGDNGFGIPGYDSNAILTAEMVDDPAQAIAVMKAMARREAGRESPLTDEQWRQAHVMFKAGSANAYLDSLAGPSSSPPTERSLDLAAAIVAAMRRKGYVVDTQPGETNIVYVEGLNEDGTINDDAADKWNDLRVVIGFDGDKPAILGKWRATTEPGTYYTEHPVNPKGAARIEFGQYQAWRIGMHRGDHEALVQRGPVTVARDLDKNMIRTGDARDSGDNFGINQHGPSGAEEAPDNVGKFSAGCLVGKTMAGHRAFMAIVKADPRFVADPEYLFRTAVLAERDVVPA